MIIIKSLLTEAEIKYDSVKIKIEHRHSIIQKTKVIKTLLIYIITVSFKLNFIYGEKTSRYTTLAVKEFDCFVIFPCLSVSLMQNLRLFGLRHLVTATYSCP